MLNVPDNYKRIGRKKKIAKWKRKARLKFQNRFEFGNNFNTGFYSAAIEQQEMAYFWESRTQTFLNEKTIHQ